MMTAPFHLPWKPTAYRPVLTGLSIHTHFSFILSCPFHVPAICDNCLNLFAKTPFFFVKNTLKSCIFQGHCGKQMLFLHKIKLALGGRFRQGQLSLSLWKWNIFTLCSGFLSDKSIRSAVKVCAACSMSAFLIEEVQTKKHLTHSESGAFPCRYFIWCRFVQPAVSQTGGSHRSCCGVPQGFSGP